MFYRFLIRLLSFRSAGEDRVFLGRWGRDWEKYKDIQKYYD
uniref:Uncharacterized protein n=1 Tax=viral metagenome TaxID=1070528 RepID=A0A6C0HK92_9ZZZZ